MSNAAVILLALWVWVGTTVHRAVTVSREVENVFTYALRRDGAIVATRSPRTPALPLPWAGLSTCLLGLRTWELPVLAPVFFYCSVILKDQLSSRYPLPLPLPLRQGVGGGCISILKQNSHAPSVTVHHPTSSCGLERELVQPYSRAPMSPFARSFAVPLRFRGLPPCLKYVVEPMPVIGHKEKEAALVAIQTRNRKLRPKRHAKRTPGSRVAPIESPRTATAWDMQCPENPESDYLKQSRQRAASCSDKLSRVALHEALPLMLQLCLGCYTPRIEDAVPKQD